VDVPYDEIAQLVPDAHLTYAEGYPAGLDVQQRLIDEAASAAAEADAAVVFVALPPSLESEGYDRAHMDLTPHQVALLKAVTAAQPRTAVVLNSGSAVATDAWAGGAAAVLQAGLMGQAGGGAVADVLFGRVDPAGRLAETFPLALRDTPAFLTYPGELGRVRYGEGIFIGYRAYDAAERPVAYPFGHGLSYTTFVYSNLHVSARSFDARDGLEVSVDVTNTGTRTGKEVVQLYVHDREAGLTRPPKELKGFAKVELAPGETTTVTLELDARSFAYYHPGHGRWITEDGDFDLLVGASATDIRLRQTVTLQGSPLLPSLLDRESTVAAWFADPRGEALAGDLLMGLATAMSTSMGAEGDGGIGMDMLGFIRDMPLLAVLHFQEGNLESTPEEIVDGLLAKVHGGGA
jgi:beta-glucosidase